MRSMLSTVAGGVWLSTNDDTRSSYMLVYHSMYSKLPYNKNTAFLRYLPRYLAQGKKTAAS